MDKITLISDFNIQVLGRYLANKAGLTAARVETTPFGQVFQSLLQGGNDPTTADELVIVWTRPEAILESFQQALYLHPVDHDAVLQELDGYCDAIIGRAANCRYLMHPSWILPAGHRGYGMLDYQQGLGLSHLLARLNLHLADRLSALPTVFMLNTENWIRPAGPRFAVAKMWYASKVPYSNAVFMNAAEDIDAALAGLAGKARKLVVLDLDNTLWGGIIGETGWEGVRLGGHDHVGEAFVDFQRHLKGLSQRGVQLAIVSKNEENVALEALDKHPEMQLRRNDFAAWRINWLDKARNITELVQELRLGLDSVVFIDDNPTERGRVSEALGDQVLVPDWPQDPAEYSSALLSLRCFDTPALSSEDRSRAQMYAVERARQASQTQVDSIEQWLTTLEMKLYVEQLSANNLPRAAQLLNKTNQMNMRTRRLSADELAQWSDDARHVVWVFRLTDRFGDSGLSGLISTEITGGEARIIDFVMSCRVMGRQMENAMLHVATEHLRQQDGIQAIVAEYIETERNHPCLTFLRQSGWSEQSTHCFSWDPASTYARPESVELVLA